MVACRHRSILLSTTTMATPHDRAVLIRAAQLDGTPAPEIRVLIEDTQAKITSLDSQIASLFEQREEERLSLAAMQYSIAPIRSVPVELLAHIFVQTVSLDTRNHFKEVMQIAQVCDHWRRVALNTPKLWTGTIYISNRKPRNGVSMAAQGLKTWLTRSAPLAVPVVFETDRKSTGMNREWIYPVAVDEIMKEILKVSSRWGSLIIRDAQALELPFLSTLSQYSLDMLQTVSFPASSLWLNPIQYVIISFGQTPSLRKLFVGRGVQVNNMSWSSLVDLDMDLRAPDEILAILPHCSDLVHLTVYTTAWPETSNSATLFALKRLQTLRWGCGKNGHFMPLLNHLLTPSLRHLRLDTGGQNVAWREAQFRAFQYRSPGIIDLELRDATLSPTELRSVLSCSPLLQHLALLRCANGVYEAAIRALRYEEGTPPLVPRLHDLKLSFYPNPLPQDILGDMIASRWWSDSQLARLPSPPAVTRWTQFTMVSDIDDEHSKHVMEMISRFKEEGLDVHIR
ncbi:F-box domain-containing protein [Favolaschia claudopus]|uniref:F-box domain-containing protein n=1 Tax=Favolaschia claudopus TaxID=2862362 RepID=A0AAW0D9A9_9AGAR